MYFELPFQTTDTMSDVVNNVFPKFAENHDEKFPRDLIIYRSGLSEGSFSTVGFVAVLRSLCVAKVSSLSGAHA